MSSGIIELAFKSLGNGFKYAIVGLKSEPVNALNLNVWTALTKTLETLENDKSVRGMIISSNLERDIFTAGNDLNELYAPGTSFDRFREFWILQTNFLANLYNTRLATVAVRKF
jgi:3,2-trans-enoyl-CoA isomerase